MPDSLHDEFVELCALSTSGELTAEEHERLARHLAICSSCRERQGQYDFVVSEVIPKLAPEPAVLDDDPSRSPESTEASVFQSIVLLQDRFDQTHAVAKGHSSVQTLSKIPPSVSQATWRNVWGLCTAGFLLCIALGISAYQVGIRRGGGTTSAFSRGDTSAQSSAKDKLTAAERERGALLVQLEQREKEFQSLRSQLQQQSSEITRLTLSQAQLQTSLKNGQADTEDLLHQRSELAQQLETAKTNSEVLQTRLDSVEKQSSDDRQKLSVMDGKLADANRLLRDRETTIDQQEELLAHDRDIRELMGARDLYVAEVFDVAGSGKTNQPYGRMFYTKDKSVLFYAFDLDKQSGVKSASTFQAWGRRGRDWQEALNLGVFYMDNTSKKRWVLKLSDPKVLAQIDAVFITVEPHGGSQKPTNKPLLFAYLHIDSNHP